MKRARDIHDSPAHTSAKKSKVDLDLVQIWEGLANEDEGVRLSATVKLIGQDAFESTEKTKLIARRLIRGLCSPRKAARLGFYVALVGCLSALKSSFDAAGFDADQLISTIMAQTTPELESSGQEQTDHIFGRLLACKAIMETTFSSGDMEIVRNVMDKTLEVVFDLLTKKPWLKNQSCQVLSSAIEAIQNAKNLTAQEKLGLGSAMLKKVKSLNQTKTSDGLFVWLRTQRVMTSVNLPQDVWTSQNPLHARELPRIKRILLDSRATDDDAAESLLGTAGWSPQLHLVWREVFIALNLATKGTVPFAQFWTEIVENGLFEPSATPERKYTGFLVLKAAFDCQKPTNLRSCFTKNLMATVVSALRSQNDAYLKRIVQDTFSEFTNHGEEVSKTEQTLLTEKRQIVAQSLIDLTNFADLDKVVGTPVLGAFLDQLTLEPGHGLGKIMLAWIRNPEIGATARNNVAIILQRAVSRRIVNGIRSTGRTQEGALEQAQAFAAHLLQIGQPANSANAIAEVAGTLREKAYQILDSLLAVGKTGYERVLTVISESCTQSILAEQEISTSIDQCKHILNRLRKRLKDEDTFAGKRPSLLFGTTIMMAQVLHDSCIGDASSAELLPDVEEMCDDIGKEEKIEDVANHIVDVVMTFMSKPTKFHRHLAELIFNSFAPFIGAEGLAGIAEILNTAEGKEGQLELFDTAEADIDSFAAESSELDSDVEIVEEESDADETGSEKSGSTDTWSEDSDADDEGDNDDNEELKSFETALAAALGTRKFEEGDLQNADTDTDGEDSDSDMSDSGMMELDQKLAEVFKNQQAKTSETKQRKEEMRMAKENVINLKNRALDLVGLFLRSQQSNGLNCAEMLTACLLAANQTGTHQISQKATSLVRNFTTKVNRAGKMPKVGATPEARSMLRQHLSSIYEVLLSKDASNAVIEAAAGLHMVYCKLLYSTGQAKIDEAIRSVCAEAGYKRDPSRKSEINFWNRYDAWLESITSTRA